jgi:hypothetical protein
MAEANGWDLIGYKIGKPPFHFSDLDALDLHNIDYARLRSDRPAVVNLANASPKVVAAITATGCDFRGLRVVRDPRQVLVSAYFHHLKGHQIESPAGWMWDRLASDRPKLESLPLEDGLLYELDNITGQLFDQQIFGWQPDSRVMEVHIEHLSVGREEFSFQLSHHLKAIIPPIDWSQSYAGSGARHWSEYFAPRIKSVFKERYGQALIRLGYAKDMDW